MSTKVNLLFGWLSRDRLARWRLAVLCRFASSHQLIHPVGYYLKLWHFSLHTQFPLISSELGFAVFLIYFFISCAAVCRALGTGLASRCSGLDTFQSPCATHVWCRLPFLMWLQCRDGCMRPEGSISQELHPIPKSSTPRPDTPVTMFSLNCMKSCEVLLLSCACTRVLGFAYVRISREYVCMYVCMYVCACVCASICLLTHLSSVPIVFGLFEMSLLFNVAAIFAFIWLRHTVDRLCYGYGL